MPTMQQLDTKFEVFTLLSKFYASNTTNQTRKDVEERLAELGMNIIMHVSDLYEIIGSRELGNDGPMKNQAAVYLHSFIKGVLRSVDMENSELEFCCEKLLMLIQSTDVALNIKAQLTTPLEHLLQVDSEKASNGGRLVQKYFELLKENSISVLGKDPNQDINGIFIITCALFKSCDDPNLLFGMFQGASNQLTTLVSHLLIMVLKQLLDQASGIQQPPPATTEYPQLDGMNIEEKLRLVKTWCVIHLDMIKKFKKQKFNQGLKCFAGSEEYARLFISVLKFIIPPQGPSGFVFDQESMILLTQCGNINYDLLMNEIKSKVLSCLKIIWVYLFKKKPKSIFAPSNQYVLGLQQFAPVITNTLIYLGSLKEGQGPTLESMCQNGHINAIAKNGIEVLCLMTRDLETFNAFFMANGFKLYLQVIIPYLKISEQERENIESNPKEFVNYAVDVCEKQESKTYKSQAAKLLENIVDHVDGMLSFVVKLNLDIITHLLSQEGQTNAPYIAQLVQKFNLSVTSEEEFLDVCLLSQTIVSYAMVKRPELMHDLDLIVVELFPKLMQPQGVSPILQSRVCLFYTFYLDQLLSSPPRQTQDALFEKILTFLFSQLDLPRERKIVSLQAMDTLQTQMNESLLKQHIQVNFDEIVSFLSTYNRKIKVPSYFDFLQTFILAHYNNFTQDNLVMFMESLVQRIQGELQEQEGAEPKKKTLSLKGGKGRVTGGKRGGNNAKSNVRINKCWNTIRFIAEHDFFAANFLSIIETSLIPLFEYMVRPNSIDFDDDIIFCLNSLMKKSKKVSPILSKIFPYLPKFQEKYKGIFGNLLQTLNSYILYSQPEDGSPGMFDDPGALNLIVEMANMSLYRKEEPIVLGNNMEGAILLQIAFQNLKGDLIKQAIPSILTNVLTRMSQQPMSKTFHRSLLEVIYSAMLCDVSSTILFLHQANYLMDFFRLAFEGWRDLRLSYERKLFTLAMTNFLFNSDVPEVLKPQCGYFLKEIVCCLMRQQRIEQLVAKRGRKVNPIIDNILLEEDSYRSSGEEGGEQEEEKKSSTSVQKVFDVVKEGGDEMETEKDEKEDEKLVVDSDFKQEEYDLHFTISEMHSRVLDMDEYDFFTQNFRRVQSSAADSLTALVSQSFTTVKLRNYLKTVLATKRVVLMAAVKGAQGGKKKKGKGSKRSGPGKKGPGMGEDMQMEDSDPEEVSEAATTQTQSEEVRIPRKFVKVSRKDPALLQQMSMQQSSGNGVGGLPFQAAQTANEDQNM